MANIEETIFDESLPVNSIAMANRLVEILKANNTNSFISLPEKDKIRYRMCLWLINQQVFGQTPIVDMNEEWNELRKLWNWKQKIAISVSSRGPMSICTCGHTGDGPNSQHDDRYGIGHGACTVEGCNCKQFTWDRFIEEEKDILSRTHNK